jgi:pyruvate dehydrogenase E2 component (dihydrolipoamide acetyltransferase)
MKKVEMPKMGDTMEEGKILHWLKTEGEQVKKGEMLAEVETDKVNIEIEAFAGGILRKILVGEGSSAPIGAAIALIGSADEPLPDDSAGRGAAAAKTVDVPARAPMPAPQPALAGSTVPGRPERIFISPIARRIAEANRLDYAGLRGSGPNGRIIKLDVEAALRGLQAAQPAPVPELLPLDTTEVVEVPLSAMRRTIARRLSSSMQTAPHFYVTSVIDTDRLAALRQQINEYAAGDPSPIKVSFNDLIIRAVAKALLRMPQMNVSFAEDRILQKKAVHIGVAVALEEGLIVPVLRDADRRGILDIARESRRLAEAARDGKLRPEDFSGGTFTVSNLGMFDVDSFTAVINPPESAILAVGSITPEPAVVDGQVVVRNRMKVTLSSDHRAIDGATAARFLQEVKRLLQEPFGLIL